MNSVILFAVLCTGAFASVQPVLNFDLLNLCPLVDCAFIRCLDGNILKKSVITLPNGKQCPGCENTCVGNSLLLKRKVDPIVCPTRQCPNVWCDAAHRITTTFVHYGILCLGCPICSVIGSII